MAIAPMWHSTIFGPYFVVGAIFSGIAALLLVMATIRKTLHLEKYLTLHHFNNLAKLLLLMSLLWLYFTVAENLTVWYGNEPKEMAVFGARARGPFAPYFWTMVFCNFVVPFVLLGHSASAYHLDRDNRIGSSPDWHVAGTLSDHRPNLKHAAACRCLGPLLANLGRNLYQCCNLCRHGSVVSHLLQTVPYRFGLGIQVASGGRGVRVTCI